MSGDVMAERRAATLIESRRLRGPRRFPIEPLVRHLELRMGPRGCDKSLAQAYFHGRLVTDIELADYLGISSKTLGEARTTGLSWLQADRYAVLAGLHPLLLWPDFHDDVHYDHEAAA